MDYLYSKTTNQFYAAALEHPDDVISCSHERYLATRFPSQGQLRQPDANGLPELVADPNYQQPAGPTLADAKQAQHQKINDACDAELASITAAYPVSEQLSWDKQESEARAWLLDNTNPTPLLDCIASERGIALVVLVDKVIIKADAMARASGTAFGKRQRLESQIDAVTLEQHGGDEAAAVAVVQAILW